MLSRHWWDCCYGYRIFSQPICMMGFPISGRIVFILNQALVSQLGLKCASMWKVWSPSFVKTCFCHRLWWHRLTRDRSLSPPFHLWNCSGFYLNTTDQITLWYLFTLTKLLLAECNTVISPGSQKWRYHILALSFSDDIKSTTTIQQKYSDQSFSYVLLCDWSNASEATLNNVGK